jgi:hypothetical protein
MAIKLSMSAGDERYQVISNEPSCACAAYHVKDITGSGDIVEVVGRLDIVHDAS